MKQINIEDIDINNSYFHFTEKSNLSSIEEQGLKAQVGDASKMVNDRPRVCLSKGGKGLLGIKNSFIYEFKKLKICHIPEGYRKYFSIKDFSSNEIIETTAVYDALEKRFKDEIYLLVDAQEGEDFLSEEIHGFGSPFDIKGKENHDINVEKLSKLITPNGNSTFDVIQYIYNRLLEKNPGKEDLIRSMNADLSEMLQYINERKQNISIQEIVSKAIKDGVNIEEVQAYDNTNKKNMEGLTKDE